MKISYKIEKSKYPDQEGDYIICRYAESDTQFNCGRVFKGTRKRCEEEIKKLKGEKR